MENKYRAGKVLCVEDLDAPSHKLRNTNPNPSPNHEKVIPSDLTLTTTLLCFNWDRKSANKIMV